MELVFNELSFREYKDEYNLLDCFVSLGELFDKAKELYNYTHIIFPSNLSEMQACENKNFIDWLNGMPTKHKNKISAIISRRPFINEFLGDKVNNLAAYYFVSSELNIGQEYCDGLATADIMDIPAISLANHIVWKGPVLTIFKETDTSPENVDVKNLATQEVLSSNEFQVFSESITKVELKPSNISIEEKIRSISLREDHGIDKLQRFAERIVKNEYVNGVINSLPYNPNTSRFVKSVYKNGNVEIIMHWEDAGYGMVINTTGRNLSETRKIAEILRNNFDK